MTSRTPEWFGDGSISRIPYITCSISCQRTRTGHAVHIYFLTLIFSIDYFDGSDWSGTPCFILASKKVSPDYYALMTYSELAYFLSTYYLSQSSQIILRESIAAKVLKVPKAD